MKVVLDTNILLDYLLDRKPFSAPARTIMELGYLKELELWISMSQVTDLIYFITDGGRSSLAEYAQHVMTALRKFIHPYAIDESDYDAVAKCTWTDLEDAFIHQVALNTRADAIITRNKAGFDRSSIKVFDCEELLAHLEEEHGLVYEMVEF